MNDPDRLQLARERARIRRELRRREVETEADRYAPWNPVEQFLVHERKQVAAELLRRAECLPGPDTRCLEIGFGRCGWLADLIGWGALETHLHGAEIDLCRSHVARRRLPAAHLVLADAGRLPWPKGRFDLIILSLVMTSVLDTAVRRRIASEVDRVLRPGGALLWYDFAVDNPGNPSVRGIGKEEFEALFPRLRGPVRRVTLAPPLARRIVPRSRALAEILSTMPFLRTHLLAVLIKPGT